MTLKSTHTELKKHLNELYSQSDAIEKQNRISCRAIALTFLHQAIVNYKYNNPIFGLSCRETIIHMLHEDAEITINNLDQIPPSLVLKILDDRFVKIGANDSSGFRTTVENMTSWLEDNQEWLSRSHEAPSDLPELQWSDLPNELFALTPNK